MSDLFGAPVGSVPPSPSSIPPLIEESKERQRQTLWHTYRHSENRDRQANTETTQDKIILLSVLWPMTTGVNIQAVRIQMDPTTGLNSVF